MPQPSGDNLNLPATVPSPLTGRPSPLAQRISAKSLVDAYAVKYNYDATHCFVGMSEIGIYQCDTGYAFYYPFEVAGDESLYRQLQTFDWNYKTDKWEYERAISYVNAADKVLDVGCGEGHFLVKAMEKGATAFGIELNRKAADIAAGKGVQIQGGSLLEHPIRDFYDVVTSFQVLEHVTDPLGFITACIRTLRPGGTLVIGVPNNDSFIRLDPGNDLNKPPHHMGLWNRRSLVSLGALTGLTVRTCETEPLAETAWYQSVIEGRYLSPWRRRLFHRFGFAKRFTAYIEENAHSIAGHSILIVFER